jgi:hypothetical protein
MGVIVAIRVKIPTSDVGLEQSWAAARQLFQPTRKKGVVEP